MLPLGVGAAVRVLQAVGTVPRVDIGHDNADAATGDYALNLPRDAARLATYSTTLPLVLASQNGTATAYTLEAFESGYVTQTKGVTVGATDAFNDFVLALTP